jgi:hypothetical protein
MSELIIYFNERCLPDFNGTPLSLINYIDSFISTFEQIIKIRPDAKIGFFDYDWGATYQGLTLPLWIKDRLSSERTRYRRLLTKIKLLTADDVAQDHEVKYLGATAFGLSFADIAATYANHGWAVSSIGGANDQWASHQLSAQRYVLAGDGTLEGPSSCSIGHLNEPEHVQKWENELLDWGSIVAPSCVLGVIGGHPIVMYPGPKEHNPPHVHLRVSNNHDGDIAKYRIDDFVREKGAPRWDKEMTEWLTKYKDQLLKSWERCQRGGHPYKLVEPNHGSN